MITLTCAAEFHRHIVWELEVDEGRLFSIADDARWKGIHLTDAEYRRLERQGCHAQGCTCGEHVPSAMVAEDGSPVKLL